MKKKVITIVLSAVLVGSLLTGCGNSSDNETPAEDAGSEAQTAGDEADAPTETEEEALAEGAEGDLAGEITVYAWTDMYTASSQVAEAFMKEHPEAKINVEQVDAAYTKLIPQLASGQDVADVFMLQNYDLMSFVNTYPGQILDVSDLIQGEESNFAEAAVQSIYRNEKQDYRSVSVFGRLEIIEEEEERKNALNAICRQTGAPLLRRVPKNGNPVVLRLRADQITAKAQYPLSGISEIEMPL